MTFDGALGKAAILLGICVTTAAFSWTADSGLKMGLMMIGLIGGFIAAMVAMFKAEWSPVAGPIYAALEGLVLGGISSLMALRYQGIVLNAIFLTFAVLALMLVLFTTRIVRVTQGLRTAVIAATLAVGVVYLIDMVMHLFGVSVPFIHSTGPLGIGISVLIVGIASFNLLLDFDSIEQNVRARAPKYMEWYCGVALLVTLVWLYLEMLRLLSKLQDRR